MEALQFDISEFIDNHTSDIFIAGSNVTFLLMIGNLTS